MPVTPLYNLPTLTTEAINEASEPVAVIRGRVITRALFSKAFDLVAGVKNWKDPIDARVILDSFGVDVVGQAVTFYTGSKATFTLVKALEGDAAHYVVTAPGYYAAVGA